MKRWGVWHVTLHVFLDHFKDKGEAVRWCRNWKRTNLARGLITPGFRVQRMNARLECLVPTSPRKDLTSLFFHTEEVVRALPSG